MLCRWKVSRCGRAKKKFVPPKVALPAVVLNDSRNRDTFLRENTHERRRVLRETSRDAIHVLSTTAAQKYAPTTDWCDNARQVSYRSQPLPRPTSVPIRSRTSTASLECSCHFTHATPPTFNYRPPVKYYEYIAMVSKQSITVQQAPHLEYAVI